MARSRFLTLFGALFASGGLCLGQTPLGSGVMYQGVLQENGAAYSGTVDVSGELFDAAVGGNPVGTPSEVLGTSVVGGVFSVEFDFGADAFGGEQRWLEVSVRGPGEPGYTTLSPRQKVTAVPQSLGPWAVVDGNAVFNGGRVGIGTSAPGAQLTIDGSSSSVEGLSLIGPGNSAGVINFSSPNGVPGLISLANNGRRRDIRFGDIGMNLVTSLDSSKPADTAGLFIADTGLVGIGTTFPGRRLDVIGDVRATAFEFDSPKEGVISVPFTAFRPQNNGVTYESIVGFRVFSEVGFIRVQAPVFLPDGARITGCEFLVMDNDGGVDLTGLTLYRSNYFGTVASTAEATTVLFSGSTSGASNVVRRFALTQQAVDAAMLVNNTNYGYWLQAGTSWTYNTVVIGARITYTVDEAE